MWIAGCDDSDKQDTGVSPLPDKPIVSLRPAEFATNVAASEQGEVGITIQSYTSLEPSMLEQLAGQVHLSTWPEASSVSTVTSVSVESRAVFVTPSQPLSDGWYELSVDPLNQELRWPAYPNFTVDADGAASSRFRVGSEPTVLTVRACPKASGSKVIVGFSEPVKLLEPMEQTLRVSTHGGDAKCAMNATVEQPAGTSAVSFACIALAATDTLRVQLTDAFASLDAPSLPVSGSTLDIELSVAELIPTDVPCSTYYVQRHLHDDL